MSYLDNLLDGIDSWSKAKVHPSKPAAKPAAKKAAPQSTKVVKRKIDNLEEDPNDSQAQKKAKKLLQAILDPGIF